MIKSALSIVFLCLFGVVTQAHSRDDARWIERARSTSVRQIEAGFPEERFDLWFADLVKPSETMYKVGECSETLPSGRESQKRLLCVLAYVKPPRPGWNSELRVYLVVGMVTPSEKQSEPAAITPVPCRFIGAVERPSDPRLKRPDTSFSKLKDVENFVRALQGSQ